MLRETTKKSPRYGRWERLAQVAMLTKRSLKTMEARCCRDRLMKTLLREVVELVHLLSSLPSGRDLENPMDEGMECKPSKDR